MGINITGDGNVVGDNNEVNVYYSTERQLPPPPVGFFGLFFTLLILVALVIKFWYIALVVVSVGAIAYGTWMEKQQKQQTEVERRRREAALSYRAEEQNSAYLRGEERGVYGNFPPPAGL